MKLFHFLLTIQRNAHFMFSINFNRPSPSYWNDNIFFSFEQPSLLFNVFIVRTVWTKMLRHLRAKIHLNSYAKKSGWNELRMNMYFQCGTVINFHRHNSTFTMLRYVSDIEYNGINVNNTTTELIKMPMNGPNGKRCAHAQTSYVVLHLWIGVSPLCDDMRYESENFRNTQQRGKKGIYKLFAIV